MNLVILTGRLTKDPDYRVNSKTEIAVAKFTLAVERKKDVTDFVNITCFEKTAELVHDYCKKGHLVAIRGMVRTGKYEKDGKTIFTEDICADRVEFLSKPEKKEEKQEELPYGFSKLTDDDIPF